MKLMHYVVNDSTDQNEPWKVIYLEQLKQRYYQPGLLPILLDHSKEPLKQVPDFENVSLPPTVRLALAGDQLRIILKDNKGGIGRVTLFTNGAEVVRDLRTEATGSAAIGTLTIPLARFTARFDTLNLLRVEAYNGEGWLHSRPETVEYRSKRQQRGGKTGSGIAMITSTRDMRLLATVVGTSNVQLRFAHQDAVQMSNGLQLAATALLKPNSVTVTPLITPPDGPAQTNKASIIAALKAAQTLRPQDVFVLYMLGHGVNYSGQDGDFYYLTAGATAADAIYLTDPAIRQQFTLSSQEITALLN